MGRYHVRRLSNGLVIGFYQKRSPLFALSFGARAGFRYESHALAGISRVCVDSLFEGSSRYPSAFLLAHALDASTVGKVHREVTPEVLRISAVALQDQWKQVFVPLSDLFFDPLFEKIRLKTGALLQGHALRSPRFEVQEDSELLRVTELCSHQLLGPAAGQSFFQPDLDHESSNEDPEILARFSSEDLRSFHAQFFQRDNCAVVLAGDADPEAVFEFAESCLASSLRSMSEASGSYLQGASRVSEDHPDELRPEYLTLSSLRVEDHHPPSGLRTPIFEHLGESSTLSLIASERPRETLAGCVSYYGPGTKDLAGNLEFQAIRRILAGGEAARLPHRLYQTDTVAQALFADLNSFADFSWMTLSFRVRGDQLRLFMTKVIDESKRLSSDPLDRYPHELPRIFGQWAREEFAASESVHLAALRMLESLLVLGSAPPTFEEMNARIYSLRPEQIQARAKEILNPSRAAWVIRGEIPRADRFAVESLARKAHE